MTEADFASYIGHVCLATFCGCLPLLLYGCEIWQMSSSIDKHKVVLWPRGGVCVLVGGRVRASDVFVKTFLM